MVQYKLVSTRSTNVSSQEVNTQVRQNLSQKNIIIKSNDSLNTGYKEEIIDTSKSICSSKQTLVGMNYTGFKSSRNTIQVLCVSGIYTSSDNYVLKASNNDSMNNLKAKSFIV